MPVRSPALRVPDRATRPRMWLVVALATLLACAFTPSAAHASAARHAGITRLAVSSVTPAFGGARFGGVGAYELVKGVAYGRLDPDDPANAGLGYLRNAPRDADGLVRYSTDFAIMRPADPAKGNGKIFYEVVNRGAPLSFGLLNGGSLTDPGNGFLMRQGYEIVWSAWQPDADPHTAAYQTHFPVAERAGGKPIVKPALNVFIPDTPESGGRQTVADGKLTADITYPPVSRDVRAAHVTLTVRENYDDPRTPLPASDVAFLSGNRVRVDLNRAMARGFDAGAIYELVYDAKDPWVTGMGFASVRDLVTRLRTLPYGGTGDPDDPVRTGRSPSAVFGWGYSQSGRFLKDFLWQGFNRSTGGRRVFDGITPMVSGAKKTDHNLPQDRYPFPQTSRWVRQHEERNYPGAGFPFTYRTLHDPVTGRTDGLLKECQATATCPKILHVDSDFESWNGNASLVTTDTSGRPVTLPPDVRAYQISGQSHGPGDGTSQPLDDCRLGSDPVDGRPVYRALVVAMDQWVTRHVRPPDSEYPTIPSGTLQSMSRAAETWPHIPGVPFNPRVLIAQAGDFSVQPPVLGPSYPVMVPATDRYGNPRGGVITPDLAAPLGTYTGRNVRSPGHAKDELCGGTGGFIPFAATPSDRNGDARPSLSELYPGGSAQFRAQRLRAAQALAARRLLLPSEVTSYADEVSYPGG